MNYFKAVGRDGIEPSTSSLSEKRSTGELPAQIMLIGDALLQNSRLPLQNTVYY